MILSTLIVELVSVLGSFASLLGLALILRPLGAQFTVGDGAFFSVAMCLLALFIVVRLREYIRLKPKVCKTKRDIRDYMYAWISRGERVAIYSRDLSWVEDSELHDLLKRKAEKHELILCLPQEIKLSKELSRCGAEVHVYPELDLVPSARFTIINFGRNDAQVAIGRRLGGVHTIQEAASGHDPLYGVAADLVQVISRLDRCR